MKSQRKGYSKKVFFGDHAFHVYKDVYEPAEDTFLVAENLVVNQDDIVLDMGTGCGILAILGAKKARMAVAVDVNPNAVRCAKVNARLHGLTDKIDVLQGDLFQLIKRGEQFHLILFNAPYLPTETMGENSWIERAWSGGPTGRQIIDRFISEASSYLRMDGKILLVQSSLSNIDETIRRFRENGLDTRILAEKKVAFETIVVIQATRRKTKIQSVL